MKKIFLLVIIFVTLSACSAPAPTAFAGTPTPAFVETPTATDTPIATLTPTIPSASATVSPEMTDRPVFLAWPLPAYIGIARISQYPNTPWTWNYLGLNEGYQCPPMFGYLLNLDSLPYWRDTSIPEEQDKAEADPHNFEMVECYSTDGNVGANGHEGTDIKAPAGTPVYAAADGKIQEWRLMGLNSMIVLKHCPGGAWDDHDQCINGRQWYTTYMHIVTNKDLLQENFAVAQGTQVGTVYDQTINSHLHFEVGLDKRSYTNFVNPWGRDSSPWLGCMWLDQSICVNPDPDYNRMLFYTNSEQLFVKQGDVSIELRDMQGVEQIRLWGDRIALLDSKNNLLIRDGKYEARFTSGGDSTLNWKIIAGNVTDFQITDRRVAILDGNRNLLVEENDLDEEWMLQAENVRAFSVSDHRLGYLTVNGELFVKEGGLEQDWITVAKDVSAFQLNDNRIAIVDLQGNLFVNEGATLAEWMQMAGSVKAFQLANVRVGIIDMDDNLLVKEGNLRANWVTLAENVRAFQLSNFRVLALFEDGSFKYKVRNVYQPWSDLSYADLKSAFLNDEVPVYMR